MKEYIKKIEELQEVGRDGTVYGVQRLSRGERKINEILDYLNSIL